MSKEGSDAASQPLSGCRRCPPTVPRALSTAECLSGADRAQALGLGAVALHALCRLQRCLKATQPRREGGSEGHAAAPYRQSTGCAYPRV
eukprot:2343058-Rhodomonas_salina.2